MTYVKGGLIQAFDFNNFIGDPGGGADKALVAFGSAAAAASRVAALYGVGYSDRGYGQTGESLFLGGVGTNVPSSTWTAMINAMTALETHQGTTTLAPPIAEVAAGQLIEAHEISSPTFDPFDINSAIALLDTNRLDTDGGLSLTTITTGAVTERATTWPVSIDCTATATFTTAEEARHFFNSGGELTIVMAQPGGSPQDIEWSRIFTVEVGTFSLRANDADRTGSGGVISAPPFTSFSYYSNNTILAPVFSGVNIGSGAYGANDVFINIAFTGSTANGARGNVITFEVLLQDQHTGDTAVGALTTVTFGHRYAGPASVLVGIEQPTWVIVDGL